MRKEEHKDHSHAVTKCSIEFVSRTMGIYESGARLSIES